MNLPAIRGCVLLCIANWLNFPSHIYLLYIATLCQCYNPQKLLIGLYYLLLMLEESRTWDGGWENDEHLIIESVFEYKKRYVVENDKHIGFGFLKDSYAAVDG